MFSEVSEILQEYFRSYLKKEFIIKYESSRHSYRVKKVVTFIEFTVSVVSCKPRDVILWSFRYFVQDIYVLVNSSQRVCNMQGHITTNESES
jgi:hypothetical protein